MTGVGIEPDKYWWYFINKDVSKWYFLFFGSFLNRIGGVVVGVIASSAIDGGFEPRNGQTKDYKTECMKVDVILPT